MAHGAVDIAVWIVANQPPCGTFGPEGDGTLFLSSFEQEWDNRVARDVTGDVLLGLIRAHLFLIYLLLENVAEHVGIDFVVGAEWALVKMPLIGIKEVEQPFKSIVGDSDVGVCAF